jgi:hypothetical protein
MYSNSVTTAGSRLLGNTNPIRPSGNPKSGRGPDLLLTVIWISRPSTNKNRIKRSIEKLDSLPCLRAEIFS